MEKNNAALKKEIEERIRIERKRKETKACKDKLYEICFRQQKQKIIKK